MPKPTYKELETLDDVKDAYNAQPSIEEAFLYVINYGTRNSLIMKSSGFISEKERKELGMPADSNVAFMTKNTSEFQKEMSKKIEAAHYLNVHSTFFADENEETHVTLDGCVRFFESVGSLKVKPHIDLGKRYKEVNDMIPKDGNTPEDLHFKTLYLMKNGLAFEGSVLSQMDFGIETLENTVYQNEPYYVGAESETLNLDLTGFLDREFNKHYDNMDSFMDAMKITDLEEREGILKNIGCDGDASIEDVKGIFLDKGEDFNWRMKNIVTNAWKNQGLKRALGSLSEKDLKSYKIGIEANSSRDDKKYKSWMKNEGDELVHDLQNKTYKDAFKKCNKIIKSTKPIGFNYPREGEMLSFAGLEAIETGVGTSIRVKDTKADINDREAKKSKKNVEIKYNAYVKRHIGEENISQNHDKNIEMLSRAMAASMLAKSQYATKFDVGIIHDTADKIKQTMKLSEMSENDVKEALRDPQKIYELEKTNMNNLYTPTDSSQLVMSMGELGKYMMDGKDRSQEYKNLLRAVKKLGAVNTNNPEDPKVQSEVRIRGIEVLRAVETYIKGKKKVRHTDDGNDRFDNAIDALAVLYKTIPGMKPDIEMIVNRINTVRAVKTPDNKYYIDIKKYGTERALVAKQKRSMRDQGIKQKSAEKPVLKK